MRLGNRYVGKVRSRSDGASWASVFQERAHLGGRNQVGAIPSEEALRMFDAELDAQVGDVKMTTSGPVLKGDQAPFGSIPAPWHAYQTLDGGRISCPFDDRARIQMTSTLFAKMISRKCAEFGASRVCADLESNQGRVSPRALIRIFRTPLAP